MYCPEHLVLMKGPLSVWMYYADVPRRSIPLRVWLNPLRYQVTWRRRQKRSIVINREGNWEFVRANFAFALKVRLGLRKPL